MSTLYVKKDGSGNSITIQGAIALASSGDTIQIEAGTFEENIDFYNDGITLNGSGKSQTFIVGQQQTSFVKAGCTWTLGSNTVSVPAGTSGLKAGYIVSGSGLATNTRIVTVSATSFTVSLLTTAARSNVSVTMATIDSAVRWRGNNNALKNVKVQSIQALATRAAIDQGAVYFKAAGLGATAAANYLLQDCEIEARGDSAIMCDNTGPAGGTVTGCTINGKTFVGAQPAQVHAFSNLALSCNVLTSSTIELPSSIYLADVVIGSPVLAVSGLVQASTTVSAISGNVLTLNKTLLSGVGTTQTITFTNIQFNVPNVARQLVVFQPNNTSPVTFTNNIVNGVTGGGISYNNAVTCDVIGSTLTGNTFEGEFGLTSYCLRVRGLNSTVSGNENNVTNNQNIGFYILPNWISSQSIQVGTMVLSASLYFECILTHTSSSTNAPTGVDGATYWQQVTVEQVNSSGVYGVAIQEVGTNISVSLKLFTCLQLLSGNPVSITVNKQILQSLVQSDVNFNNELNWEIVGAVFKKNSKRLVSGFRTDFTQSNQMKLRDGLPGESFLFHKAIVSKSGRVIKVISRNDVADASKMDFVLK